MQIITLSSWLKFLSLWISIGIAYSDNLTLDSNNRLQGQISAINPSGQVELVSEISPDQVLIKSGVVRRIDFNSNASPFSELPNAMVRLMNDDVIPVTLVNLTEKELEVSNRDLGILKIPRVFLKSLTLGSNQKRIIYTGPKSMDEWVGNDTASGNWRFSNDYLIADGSAKVSKEFDTPTNFSLKFTLKWKSDPNFKILFADTANPEGIRADRYYLRFNSDGLEIVRESGKGQHLNPVILMPRITPDKYPDRQMIVVIRVNRTESRIELLINGESEMEGVDSVGNLPKGNMITCVSDAPQGITQEIGQIEISTLNNPGNIDATEDSKNSKSDHLISHNQDFWSGQVLGFNKRAKGSFFMFKSDFQDEPLEIDAAEISAINFAEATQVTNISSNNDYALKLLGNGMLTMTSCLFLNDYISAEHPLLGAIKIKKSGIAALEWTRPVIEDVTKEKAEK